MKTAQLRTYNSTSDATINRTNGTKTYSNITRASYNRIHRIIQSQRHEGYFTPLYSCIFITEGQPHA